MFVLLCVYLCVLSIYGVYHLTLGSVYLELGCWDCFTMAFVRDLPH